MHDLELDLMTLSLPPSIYLRLTSRVFQTAVFEDTLERVRMIFIHAFKRPKQ